MFIFAFVYYELAATLIISTHKRIPPSTTYRSPGRVVSFNELICDKFEFRDGVYWSSIDMSSLHCLSKATIKDYLVP